MNRLIAADTRMYVAGVPVHTESHAVAGALVESGGQTFYRVSNVDAIPPFLMSLVSDADHWMFVSSTGALTAGRASPDQALFPYQTDDRIHDGHDDTGSVTILRVHGPAGRLLWEPFSNRWGGAYRISRNLYKSTAGNKVVFEEINHDLSLTFSYSWAPSARFGFVRSATLANHADRAVDVEVLDGIRNVLPAGIGRDFQARYSTLVDGYKHSELDPETGLALLRLSSVPSDSARPNEALRTSTAWSRGLDGGVRLLSSAQVDRFRAGLPVTQETEVRGRRGAYLTGATVTLAGGANRRWIVVADVEQDAAGVILTRRLLRGDPVSDVDNDVRRGRDALIGIVAAADGLQATGDELSACRHFANTLYNVMRGGTPANGYVVPGADFAAYLDAASPRVAARHAGFLAGLPAEMPHADLLAVAAKQQDDELERLAHQYLPLRFSRRHGDPSRPWNDFRIPAAGTIGYQGNWRDIFQNWEALAYSYPGYVESMVFRFLNASTADGHNPCRLTRDGFDWEVPDPDDPWSNVGYWGDHQVVYLLKLLEVSARFHPGRLAGLLDRRLFTYAEVPYRIRPYEELLADPRGTIDFDAGLDRELRRRDQGAYLLDGDGEPLKVTLAEKLLVVALARLANYVPEAGIWLNTQRPEWNDANNALVGYGVSVVTLCHLRRYLAFCRGLFDDAEVSVEVATLFRRVSGVLSGAAPSTMSGRHRRAALDALGGAASEYRTGLYSTGLSGSRTAIAGGELRAFCDTALAHLDHSIRANRRPDGLYHAYNLMRVGDGTIGVRHLYEMLEGQVAALSSGALGVEESVEVLDALRASALYRADQNSYLLYPDRTLPRFLARNVVPAGAVERSPLLSELMLRGDRRLLVPDVEGGLHFDAALHNAADLDAALSVMAADPDLADLVAADRGFVLDLYEQVFDHQSFTGRSGTFYKYEGLGCVYWHMVSKLLLAIHEIRERADPATAERIRAHYEAVRDGIGVHKSPRVHGAIPVEPYSHTPGFAGVQQPGMTGQVKEDIIARIGEMGVTVVDGRIRFRPDLVRGADFLVAPRTFGYVDVAGVRRAIPVPAGALACTLCQVPIVVHGCGPARVVVTRSDGAIEARDGLALDERTSAAIFDRTGSVSRVDVYLGTLAARS